MEQLGEMAREAAYTYGGDIMNVAVYEHDRIIKNVIVLDFIPQDMENEFYIECPAWCWIGDSIDKPKPDDWVDITEDKTKQLDSQYEQDKKTLQGYYLDFMIAGDTDGMEQIKGELTALATQYDSDIEALKGGEE